MVMSSLLSPPVLLVEQAPPITIANVVTKAIDFLIVMIAPP
jgi:hypothetical protein